MTKSVRPHPTKSDRQSVEYARLVEHAARGDRNAMERLLTRAQEAAYRFSLLVCGHQEDAEDVMQDTLLRTYRHVGAIRRPEAFRTWLYQTVRNACLMKRRRRVDEPARLASIEHGEASSAGAEGPIEIADRGRLPDQQLIDDWMGARLRRALEALPAPYRTIVVLREIEGLSTRETASVTGLSEANVKARLHRARTLLRRKLEAE